MPYDHRNTWDNWNRRAYAQLLDVPRLPNQEPADGEREVQRVRPEDEAETESRETRGDPSGHQL